MPPTEAMVSLLGGTKILGRSVKGEFALSDAIVRGLPQQSLQHVRAVTGLTNDELAELLGVSEKTLSRLRHSPKATLSTVASDRLYRLVRVYATVKQLTSKDEHAVQWLREPQVGLFGRIPLEMMKTEIGTQEVEDELGRVMGGIPM